MKGKTPDEKFLLKLYEVAMAEGGDPFVEMDVGRIGRLIGQKETATKNIIKHLAQANFVKKVDEQTLYLTERGCNFVLDNLED